MYAARTPLSRPDRTSHPRRVLALVATLAMVLGVLGAPAEPLGAQEETPEDEAVSPQQAPTETGEDEEPVEDLPDAELDPEQEEVLDELAEDYEGVTEEELAFFEQYVATQALLDNLTSEINQLESDIAAAEEELAAAEAHLAEVEQRLAASARRLLMDSTELASAEQLLQHQAVEAYINGGSQTAATAAVLGAESSNRAGAVVAYSDVLASEQREAIAQYQGARDASRASREAEAAEREEAAEIRDGMASRRAELEARHERQVQARLAVEETARQSEELLGEAAERRAEFEQRIASSAAVSDGISGLLAGIQEGQSPPPITTGIFLPPLAGAQMTSSFGPRVHPIYGVARMHNGVDFNGSPGTPIRASDDGEVVIAENRDGYGLTVVIDHGNGLGTLYAHMSAFAVIIGDEVERGDVIGGVGSTGLSTGPHLHWEVRVFGQPVNPVPYLGPDEP